MTIKIFDSISKIELSKIVLENSLYEKTFMKSRFKTLADNALKDLPFIPFNCYEDESKIQIESFTVLMKIINNNPIGIVVLENYNHSLIRSKFKSNGTQYNFNMIGFIGCYVKEEFRKNGIASELIKNLEIHLKKTIKKEENTVYMISASSHAFYISKKYINSFFINQSPSNYSYWLSYVKNVIKYYPITLMEKTDSFWFFCWLNNLLCYNTQAIYKWLDTAKMALIASRSQLGEYWY